MTKIQQCASLHPTTVQKVAEGFLMAYPRRTRRITSKRGSEVKVLKLDELIVKYLRINNIPVSRIEVISETEIIVHN